MLAALHEQRAAHRILIHAIVLECENLHAADVSPHQAVCDVKLSSWLPSPELKRKWGAHNVLNDVVEAWTEPAACHNCCCHLGHTKHAM